MTRLAMTRLVEGGSEVPVAMRLSAVTPSVVERWKKRAGTVPQVTGAMNDATAV